MSNPRLFGGRLGASTAMTRSIGDRNAARCCIAEPEIVTTLVPADEPARVIIASDGLWDAVSNSEAELASRGYTMSMTRSTGRAAAGAPAAAAAARPGSRRPG